VQAEQERRDDAEVAAAAANRPEQVGVLVRARTDALAAGQHELGLEQVVDREPEGARQVPETPAEREPADAGGRDDAAGGRQSVLAGREVDLAPCAAAADAHGARLRIDLDVAQQREVDHDAVVARPQPGAVVPAAADGERQVVLARESDGPGHVLGPGAARDQRRPLVDHRVVDLAGLVVVGVLRADQPALEVAELVPGGACGRGETAHWSPPRGSVRRRASRNWCVVS
jgi:hypothetical protein